MKDSIHDNGSQNFEANDNKLPTFPDTLFPQLPHFLQEAVKYATSSQERDMLLLGTITCISSCIPKIYGIYDGEKVYSNLYLYVTAPPSSGKGKLNLCKKIILPIHNLLREETKSLRVNNKEEFDVLNLFDEQTFKNLKQVKSKSTVEKMLFIPANNSSTGMFQLLSDNDGRGMIFETEGDTVTLALKSDYGNYSDGFRKAFHHETISYYRRTDKEYVEIESPCLSVILSGTPKQVISLIPNAENGLFSRFIFYYLDLESSWIDVFEHSSLNTLDVHYNNLGIKFLEFHNLLNDDIAINISLSESQKKSFKNFFSKIQTKYLNIKSDEYIATIRRLGIISFRFAMIFSTLRIMEDGDISTERECSDIDFENAMMIIPILIQHSRKVFSTLPKDAKPSSFKSSKEEFIEALPKSFCREDYLDIATKFGVNAKTAERYITNLVKDNILNKKSHNNYINTLIQDDVESKEIEDSKDISPTPSISPKSLDPQ